MKRVFIIHGWADGPGSNWIPWLMAELSKKGFEVHAPQMPNTNSPKMGEWVLRISEQVGEPDTDTYFVGHSLGCQAILRYLEGLAAGKSIGGAVLVAGFMTIRPSAMKGSAKKVLSPWVDNRIDLPKARAHARIFVSIFSANDPWIPLDDAKEFEKGLESKVIIMPGAGHFTAGDGYLQLHAALNELLKIASIRDAP